MKPPTKSPGNSTRPDQNIGTTRNALIPVAGLLDQDEAARLLHVRPRTLETWRQHRRGPRFVRYSQRCVRYRPRDLQE
jgi:hypothetical protein